MHAAHPSIPTYYDAAPDLVRGHGACGQAVPATPVPGSPLRGVLGGNGRMRGSSPGAFGQFSKFYLSFYFFP